MSDFGATHEEQIDALNDEVRELVQNVIKMSVERDNLCELLTAADRMRPALEVMSLEDSVKNFYKALRKVRGMK